MSREETVTEQPETSETVLRRSLERLERAATEVHRLGAATGPQWSKLAGALIKARVALMTTPKSDSVAFLATTERAACIKLIEDEIANDPGDWGSDFIAGLERARDRIRDRLG